MKKWMPKEWNILSLAIFLFLLDGFWGFIYTRTIYAKPIWEYVSVLLFLFLFLYIANKYHWGAWSKLSRVWAPYILLTFMGYALTPSIRAPYWLICLILLLVAQRKSILTFLPSNLLFWGGIFAFIGIMVQIFLPSFYNARISGLFLNDEDVENWSEGYGFNGFTFQLGVTAAILIYGEVVLLYLKEKILNRKFQNPILYYLLLIIFVIGVFLTGKRLLSVLAFVLPFLILFFSKKLSAGKIFTIFFVVIIAYIAFDFFITNISNYSDSLILRRFVYSYEEAKAGNDITSDRTYLFQLAWGAFERNPILGIGVGQFRAVTGATTAVHNTYMQVLCEQGIFGFMLFFLPIVYSFIYTIRLTTRVKDKSLFNYLKVSLAFQLIYIIYSMTGNENIGTGYIMYFLGIAIIISIEKELNDRIKKNKVL